MARKAIARSLLGLLLVAVAAWAGDPWKEKPFRQWTAKDVEKIFSNSPWARRVRILSGDVALGRPRTDTSVGLGTGQSPTGGSSLPGSDDFGGPGAQAATRGARISYTVRWESALTIRQAKVRQQELQQGSVEEQAAEQFLRTEPQQYEIVVFGRNMRPFEEMGEEALRESAYLQPRKSKRKIAAQRVESVKPRERLLAVRFFFPRALHGEPLIGSQEKKVRFYCKSSLSGISTDFDIRKMTRESGPDF